MAKNAVFSPIWQRNFKTMRSIFGRFDEKHNSLGNFEKFLKIFDENSMEKLNFSIFWENLLLKIETSEITSLFYNNSFRFGGGGGVHTPKPPPAYATVWEGFEKIYKNLQKSALREFGGKITMN